MMRNQRKIQKPTGFTLIELLVVIAIIGTLASVVIAAFSIQRQKARDTRRISDLKQVKTAFDLYLSEAAGYPDDGIWSPNNTLVCTGQTIIRIPVDPLTPTYDYTYTTSGESSVTTICGGAATVWSDYRLDFYMENKGAWYYMDEDGRVFDTASNPVAFDQLL